VALVNLSSARKKILSYLRKASVREGVEVLSYKRNRGIALVRTGDDKVAVRERGYCDRELTVTFAELPKLLRSMMGTEFPRSRKVRVCRLSGEEAGS
jgi:hypothetical protein